MRMQVSVSKSFVFIFTIALLTLSVLGNLSYGDTDLPQIYWTDRGSWKIQRANLDGTNVQDLVTTGLGFPGGIALDMADRKMYWTDWNRNKIQRANLDGTHVEDLVTTGLNYPWDITLDVADRKMYWVMGSIGGDAGEIRRANLDGTNVQTLVTGLHWPRYITLDVAGGKMYWTIAKAGASAIQRANLDGTNVEVIVPSEPVGLPGGVALAVSGDKLYWTDWFRDTIGCANLDGSNVQTLVTGLDWPGGITLDVAGGKIYWTIDPLSSSGTGKIQRANLDGTNVQDLVTGLDSPRYIALGIPQTSGTITFSPNEIPDQTFTVGTPIDPFYLPLATGGTVPYTYTLEPLPAGLSFDAAIQVLSGTPTTAAPATPITYTATDTTGVSATLNFNIEVIGDGPGPVADPVDVNGDGQVNVIDLAIVALFYGTQVPDGVSVPADVNGDGIVNILDLTAVAQGIDAAGNSDTFSTDDVAAVLEAIAGIEGVAGAPARFSTSQHALLSGIAYRNVAAAFADVKHLATDDVRLGKWMPMLKELLHRLAEMRETPDTTALLPNYPNPFNPETWIPYHLATDAAVVLTIYDVRGNAVRTLTLGHQPAGVYESRGRAAYWDGKNQIGEPVASGLYFYTLTAGEFTATRRLLIVK